MRGRKAEDRGRNKRGGQSLGFRSFDFSTLHPLPSALFLFVLSGCGSDDRLVPLSVGRHWDYRVRWGVQREIGRVQVAREVSIGDGVGYELKGPMGVSRLGYEGKNVVADQLAGVFLTPPLPIGVPVDGKASWRGWVDSPLGRLPAKAQVSAESAKLKIAGRDRKLNKTVVNLLVGGKTIELTTWLEPGQGIVQQEQRTNGDLDLGLERIAG